MSLIRLGALFQNIAFAVFFTVLLLPASGLQAQVAVNTDGSTADPSAMLDVKSAIRGILIPRMSTMERENISTPATGLLVFDSDTNTFWFFNGTAWEQMMSASVPPVPVVITPPLITTAIHD